MIINNVNLNTSKISRGITQKRQGAIWNGTLIIADVKQLDAERNEALKKLEGLLG